MLVLSRDDLRELLDMEGCIDAVERAHAELAGGRAVAPPRSFLQVPERGGRMAVMAAALPDTGALGIKAQCTFPVAPDGRPFVSGLVALYDAECGAPLAVMDSAYVTAVRTAAASAMATRRLAREDAAVLAIIGAGVQARMHFRAMRAVRPVEAVRVWSPRRETAEALAQEIEEEYALSTRVCADAEEAVRPADLVCTVTRATSPVVKGAWLAHGVHVNAIGSHTADARELDSDAVAGARVFVDSLEGALLAGDLCVPLEEGRIAPHHVVGEIGEVLAGTKPGRLSDEDVTVYKSVGIAVQDVAAALFVFANARRSGRGVEVQL